MWTRKKSKKLYNTPDQLPLHKESYPVGVVVVTERGRFLINRDGKRYRIPTDRIFASWNFPLVTVSTETALAGYPIAATKLGFRDGTLLNNIANGKMYLVSENLLRHVTSPRILSLLGLTKHDAVDVSDAEIKIMKVGEDIY
jgi:hypothetical protein